MTEAKKGVEAAAPAVGVEAAVAPAAQVAKATSTSKIVNNMYHGFTNKLGPPRLSISSSTLEGPSRMNVGRSPGNLVDRRHVSREKADFDACHF
jgi:hypothetical protein